MDLGGDTGDVDLGGDDVDTGDVDLGGDDVVREVAPGGTSDDDIGVGDCIVVVLETSEYPTLKYRNTSSMIIMASALRPTNTRSFISETLSA